MINAKELFREGWVRLDRPFEFGNLKYPLQKLTMVYAYAEGLKMGKQLSKEAKESIDRAKSRWSASLFGDALDREYDRVTSLPSSWEEVAEGQILQTYIDGQTVRLFPGEYTILDKNQVKAALSEPGYHTVPINGGAIRHKAFRDQLFFLRSRGLNKGDALRYASIEFPGKYYYKPYFALLTYFCRNDEILPDEFYEEVENIRITRAKRESGRGFEIYVEDLV